MTHVIPKRAQGSEISAGMSTDQIAAVEFAKQTQLGSLELALEGRDFAGSCDAGYSCAYTNTISWRTASTPLPMENDPRAVFERLFGDGAVTDPAARLARTRADRSILDSVTARISDLGQRIGPNDRAKLGEYLEALRDVERRIQKAEDQNARELTVDARSARRHPRLVRGPRPADVRHAGARLSDRPDARHHVHDRARAERPLIPADRRRRIASPDLAPSGRSGRSSPASRRSTCITRVLFAYYLEKLRATPDGDGSLLDHVMIIYGAGMADSNLHAPSGLPVLLAGGGAGSLPSGRHIKYPIDTPLANLHLALLDKLGVAGVSNMGDSTGPIESVVGRVSDRPGPSGK